jgi:hypothetical protein
VIKLKIVSLIVNPYLATPLRDAQSNDPIMQEEKDALTQCIQEAEVGIISAIQPWLN